MCVIGYNSSVGYGFLVSLVSIVIGHSASGILFHNVSFTTSVLRHTGVGILAVHRFRDHGGSGWLWIS